MRLLLTGGAGFIGSHLAEHLLARGHEVAIVDDLSSGRRENLPDGAVLYGTGIRSGRSLASIFREFEPEALARQAAQMNVRRSVREPDFDADVNVVGTVRLLQKCVEHRVGSGSLRLNRRGGLRGADEVPRARRPSPVPDLSLRRLEARRGDAP